MNTLDIKKLLPELKKQVTLLADDLLTRVTGDAKINDGLQDAFKQIEQGGRTAQAYEVWLEDYLDQVAVAWVLSCVFVRFMEDNGLIDECWLAGEGPRRKLAEDTHELFFREHPRDSDREYFQHVFREVGKIPAAADLFAEGKTPLWAVGPSGDAAMKLLNFWREQMEDMDNPPLKRSFQVESGDTRFLGDLYQELSEKAKKKYALLQTPVFVEEFILDRTLTPAIDEFSLEKVRMIDPTCGSGHFLLGGFARLLKLWSRPEYTTGNAEKDAQKALDGIWGVDLNPFAVAIARFRLIVAAVLACGIERLKEARGWTIHLASGDSLLFGKRPSFDGGRVGITQQLALFEVPAIYAVEDRKSLQEILGQSYHVVVGNPPYIIVRDRSQNAAYRQLYSTCHQKYSLGVPFAQRFCELAMQPPEVGNNRCGHIGMITANSFMKREFGKKLIQDFFPKIDLTHVVDTSGGYIPGHGTPTVILFARARKPVGETVRAVLGIKGEPATPNDPSQGLVWRSIIEHIDIAGSQSDFTSTTDILRSTFNTHPWSIGGGGAAELKELLEEDRKALSSLVDSIGFMAIASEDDAYIVPVEWGKRTQIACSPFATGDNVRDWAITTDESVVFPYSDSDEVTALHLRPEHTAFRHFWPYKTGLRNRLMFGKTPEQHGMSWYEFMHLSRDRLLANLLISFACVATHNHFVLHRGTTILNRHAPVIALIPEATEDDHFGLLGLLNSSIGCFWMQQTLHNKGGPGGGSSKDEKWHDFYEFSGTALERFPVTEVKPVEVARKIDTLGRQYMSFLPEGIVQKSMPTEQVLTQIRKEAFSIRGQMIALQEELDWQCHQLYGLCPDDLCYSGSDLPEVALGERAFEIVLARRIQEGSLATKWFEWLQISPLTEIPSHWPTAYVSLIQRRIKVIETNSEVALIEKPDCKRRWESESWNALEERALKNWLVDRLETPEYRKGTQQTPDLTTTAQIADVASSDEEFLQVAALYRGRPDFDVAALVGELVESESVPFLPICRYKPSGLRKREVWERTWDLQRQEDGGKALGDIPVPPKYATTDFLKTDFWRLRGKLDVPKERWVSYPHCATEGDPSLVVGWAGWNHLEQATALVAYYDARKREGWAAERLKPLLAGLDQLIPWIHQWHPEVDPEYGETAGQSFQHMLESDAHELGLTLEDIRNWTPPQKPVKVSKKKASTKKSKGEQAE